MAAGRATDMPVMPYLVGVLRPLLACVPMFAAVLAVEAALDLTRVPIVVSLIVEIITGGVVYVVASLVLVRDTSLELMRLGKGALRRRSPADT